MTRRKRRIIIIAVIVLVVAIISTALVWIYLNTDMLKSNETLFIKYMGKNVENVEEYLPNIGNAELNSLLEQNKYTFNTTVKVNYTQNIGTTLENTDNVINQLKINANGQTDKTNRYQYQDIKLLQKNNEVFRVEYIQNDSIYGLRFSDLFKQYILVENTNLKDFAQKIGYSEEQIQETSNKINWQFDFSDIFSLTEYEKQSLQNKYIGILVNGISKENFSKQSDVTITIDGKSVYTNSYTLTVTKEQLNKIYINILEELKQDEIILSKIENIQSQINNSNLKDEFIAKIENTIDEINKNNIGQDETKIIVYENQKNDVHPPLYYLLLRIAMGFRTDSYSKWSGIILNIIIYIFITIFIYLIIKKLLEGNDKYKEKSAILALISSLTLSSINNAIYIRMYALATLNIVITTYLHLKLLDKKENSYKLLVAIGIFALVGSLTHYYYLFYLAMLFIMFVIKYVKEKNYKEMNIVEVINNITKFSSFNISIASTLSNTLFGIEPANNNLPFRFLVSSSIFNFWFVY